MLLEQHKADIDAIRSRYAERRSAVLPLLYIAQDVYGHLSDAAIREVAEILDLPPTDIFEVAGFYTLFYTREVGKWVIQVCDDVPCCYLGAEELITALKDTLGVKEDETTSDGIFTIQRVKCLAACHRAPVVQANLDYFYDVTADKVDALLHALRERAARGDTLSVSGHRAEDYEIAADGSAQMIERRLGPMPASPAVGAPVDHETSAGS